MSLPDPEPPATTVGIAATKFCHRSNRNYREKLTIVFKRPAVAREFLKRVFLQLLSGAVVTIADPALSA
jgi:hypothetical protein